MVHLEVHSLVGWVDLVYQKLVVYIASNAQIENICSSKLFARFELIVTSSENFSLMKEFVYRECFSL